MKFPTRQPPALNYQAFGLAVARLRRTRGLTLEELSEASGVTRQTILNVENNHKAVSLETAHALAFALEVPLPRLIEHLLEGQV